MGPGSILMIASALGGAAAAGAGFHLAGSGAAIAASGAVMGGVSALACIAALRSGSALKASEARFDTLAEEMVLLRQRQAEFEGKLKAVEQKTAESPALVWRAATADIQVLGGLVSELAKAVADHEERLKKGSAPALEPGPDAPVPTRAAAAGAEPARSFVLPETTPPPASWFEDEIEAAFAAEPDPVPAEDVPVRPEGLSAAVMAELRSTLAAALSSERLELCLQPFVTLPQRKVAGYEATLRLKGEKNELQSAAELRAAAEAAGMGRELDRILIERTGQVLRVLRARERIVSITCPAAAESLTDPSFRSAVEAVARSEGKHAQNLTLSFPMADAVRLRAADSAPFDAIRRMGVSLGVRAAGGSSIDTAALERIGVTEMRMPAGLLMGPAARGDIHPADIAELLDRRGIRLLVTDVDGEQVVRDLLDLSAALAQGELFGGSRPVRPEVLQPRPVAGDAAAAARPRQARTAGAAEAERRQSFRSMLRRA